MADDLLAELQATLDRDIPMCRQMGIRACSWNGEGLTVSAPLAQNHNHQQTAFAGSLNALCTVAGWGSVFLLAREHNLPSDIVIRRGTIKYLRPVDTAQIVAVCQPIEPDRAAHFLEMLKDKGQAKIDLHVEITAHGQTAVSFHGSYVVLGKRT